MKKYILQSFLILLTLSGFSQHDWNINTSDYSYTHQVFGKAYIDGGIVNGINIEIGAFCGDECRGIATTNGGSCTYSTFDLTVYSNQQEGEVITFVLRDTDLTEYEIINTIIFVSGEESGDYKVPFLWMDEWLYQSTDFFSFSVLEDIAEAEIDLAQKTITLNIAAETEITALTPLFFIAPGAKVFIGEEQQFSQQTITDYSNPVTYRVNGVDGIISYWTVLVNSLSKISYNQINEQELNIFPTVSTDGIITVVSQKEFNYILFSSDGKVISSSLIKPGTTQLNIQKSGSYSVCCYKDSKFISNIRIIVL